MAQNRPTPQNEDERNDLLATIAASRELGPEMDETLASRYLEERQKADARVRKPQPNQSLATTPQGPQGLDDMRRRAFIFGPIAGVIVVAAIVATFFGHFEALGIVFVLFLMFGRGLLFGGRWRQNRWQRRYYRRYGPYGAYGPNGPDGSLPPDVRYPDYPGVGAPPPNGYQQLPQPRQQPTPAAPPPTTATPAPHQPTPPINPAG